LIRKNLLPTLLELLRPFEAERYRSAWNKRMATMHFGRIMIAMYCALIILRRGRATLAAGISVFDGGTPKGLLYTERHIAAIQRNIFELSSEEVG
jgi:hypothetical protein